jgi:hypothetical protein
MVGSGKIGQCSFPKHCQPNTTGIQLFAECLALYRVHFVGHSAKLALPSAALGDIVLSAKTMFTERATLGKINLY